MNPVVVDLDGSVGHLPEERRISMPHWQETLRFGCSKSALESFGIELTSHLERSSRLDTVLIGSGDFHHVSQWLIARQVHCGRAPFEVVVFDNHPDNMIFPFGIHCGSWVGQVAAMPGVSHVHVVGVTSRDVSWINAWQNQFGPLRRGQLTYWCIGAETRWAALMGLREAVREFQSPDALVEAFCRATKDSRQPVYLSIDKDVFAPEVVHTNWDQGRLLEHHAHSMIHSMTGRIIASDITGDVSAYRYRTLWKRLLSSLDGQSEPSSQDLARWRPAHHSLDQRLLQQIGANAPLT